MRRMTNKLILAEGVQGNISDCEIQSVMVDTNYAWYKFSYTETTQVINKCDMSIQGEYSEIHPGDITLLAPVLLAILLLFSLLFIKD